MIKIFAMLLAGMAPIFVYAEPARPNTQIFSFSSGDGGDDSGAAIVTSPWVGWGTPCDGGNFVSLYSHGFVDFPGQTISFTRSFVIPEGFNLVEGNYEVSYEADDQIQIYVNDVRIAGCSSRVCFTNDGSSCRRSASGKVAELALGPTNTLRIDVADNPEFGAFIMGSYTLSVELFEGVVTPTVTPPPTATPPPTSEPTPTITVEPTQSPTASPTASACNDCEVALDIALSGISAQHLECDSATLAVCGTACAFVPGFLECFLPCTGRGFWLCAQSAAKKAAFAYVAYEICDYNCES